MEQFVVVETPVAEWERLYWYFVRAEKEQLIVTSVTIQQVFPCAAGAIELSTVRWHMNHYWRWFLICVDNTVRPYEYMVRRIAGYPVEYFVRAHTLPNHAIYFAHFVRSMEKDNELRKAAQGTGVPRKPRSKMGPFRQLPDRYDQQEVRERFDDIPVDTYQEEEGNTELQNSLIVPPGVKIVDTPEDIAVQDRGESMFIAVQQEDMSEANTVEPGEAPSHPEVALPEQETKKLDSVSSSSEKAGAADAAKSVLRGCLIIGTCLVLGLAVYLFYKQAR